jgi:glutaredoxin
MKIVVYKKSGCPWAAAVIGFLSELDAVHEVRNVSTHPHYALELEGRSKKCMSPTVIIDGEVIEDASVEDVAQVLEDKGIIL